ncbi:glycoside hydrolase family 43 protein [Paenibacillus glycanilyticus]|uniref:Glycoside hydrolase 43 family protein n=1 Tax=Paenibacillus glycanilyticus TaxID=126569 RepID=A0ABQ6G7A9_9BACL|nr:glycoside hydrolase family 43 protein [Paenibacillus glycanilyticus]GLX66330.1 glycoside hydrolase 43 family protein [Paenibacillus glycanilyticus]
MKYTNPILKGFYPDPSICRVNEDYYLVTSSFGYYPGVPIFHSKDMVNWTMIGYCLTRESQLPLFQSHASPKRLVGKTGIYAPTLRHHNGRFYMVTTNQAHYRNFVVSADQPEGPWSDPVDLEWGGIDPSLLFDDDGKVYITGTRSGHDEPDGIYQAEIDLKTGELVSERRLIWEGTGGSYPEGPHLYRIGNLYYLLIAEGGTEYGHMATIARSDNPYGPFESCPHNPILSHRNTNLPIQATGHVDLVQAHDDSWWAVCLGIRPYGYPFHHNLGRETFLLPVKWTNDGWPVLGDHGRIHLEMEAPSFFDGYAEIPSLHDREDFSPGKLRCEWNSIRNSIEGICSLNDRPGWLALYGTEFSLDDIDVKAFVGRRQQDYCCRVKTLLDFSLMEEGEEAGLTTFMNENSHYDIAVTVTNGKRQIIFRRRIGSLWKIEHRNEIVSDHIILAINADMTEYRYSYAIPGEEEIEIGTGEVFYLSTEVAGGYTGVYFGMYASGNGHVCKGPAYFDYFDYQIF